MRTPIFRQANLAIIRPILLCAKSFAHGKGFLAAAGAPMHSEALHCYPAWKYAAVFMRCCIYAAADPGMKRILEEIGKKQ